MYGCEIWNLILCARVSSLRRPDKHYVTQAVELAKLEIIQDEKKKLSKLTAKYPTKKVTGGEEDS